jgi:hypothetical protein
MLPIRWLEVAGGRVPRNYVGAARIESPQGGASRSCKTQAIEGFCSRYLHTDYVSVAYQEY